MPRENPRENHRRIRSENVPLLAKRFRSVPQFFFSLIISMKYFHCWNKQKNDVITRDYQWFEKSNINLYYIFQSIIQPLDYQWFKKIDTNFYCISLCSIIQPLDNRHLIFVIENYITNFNRFWRHTPSFHHKNTLFIPYLGLINPNFTHMCNRELLPISDKLV